MSKKKKKTPSTFNWIPTQKEDSNWLKAYDDGDRYMKQKGQKVEDGKFVQDAEDENVFWLHMAEEIVETEEVETVEVAKDYEVDSTLESEIHPTWI